MSVIPSPRIRSAAALVAVAAVALVPGTAAANRNGQSLAKNGHSTAINGHSSARLRDAGGSAITSLTAVGACDATNHTNAFGASVMLNTQRFPDGAHVVVRYGYRRPGAASGPRTRWYGPTKISNYLGTTAPDVWGDGVPMYGPVSLRDVSFPVSAGRIIAWAQVGVWNGSGYEYSYVWGDHYVNRTAWGSLSAASCWLS